MAIRWIFWGFCINRFLMSPLPYLSCRFWLRIWGDIQNVSANLNPNSEERIARDLCQTDLCKNLGKSASLPCPFNHCLFIVNHSLVIVNHCLVMVNHSLVIVNHCQVMVNHYLVIVNHSLVIVNHCLVIVNPFLVIQALRTTDQALWHCCRTLYWHHCLVI